LKVKLFCRSDSFKVGLLKDFIFVYICGSIFCQLKFKQSVFVLGRN
jgi:hypothetical protein